MIGLAATGAGQVLGAVAGLAAVAWVGEGVIKEMGYQKIGTLWVIIILVAGSTVVFKWAWDKVGDAFNAFGGF